MGTISVRLSDEEDKLIRKYAEINGMDLSSLFRNAVINKIEEEYDLTLFDNIWQDEKGCEIISHEEMKSELGLL